MGNTIPAVTNVSADVDLTQMWKCLSLLPFLEGVHLLPGEQEKVRTYLRVS